MRVAVAQIRASTDPLANLDLVERSATAAAEAGAELVVFPEATMCSFERRSSDIAEAFDGPWASHVRALATRLHVTIIVGMFTTTDDTRVRNTLLIAGRARARYDKVHLFDALGFRESDHIAAGDRLVTVDLPATRIGVATCYDLRFPEQFIALATDDAAVIVVCASWAPGPDKIHQWRTLATARAMDSTAFVVAVDQATTGDPEEPGRPTGVGHSMVVDPTGRVLLELGPAPQLAFIDLDPGEVYRARAQLPVLRNR